MELYRIVSRLETALMQGTGYFPAFWTLSVNFIHTRKCGSRSGSGGPRLASRRDAAGGQCNRPPDFRSRYVGSLGMIFPSPPRAWPFVGRGAC